MPSIEVEPTALASPMTVTFNSLQAIVMTYSRAKVQRQRSVGFEDRVETNGQTDGGYCITSLARHQEACTARRKGARLMFHPQQRVL